MGGRGGDTRIVCAAVAKSEMIFEFIRKEEIKRKNKQTNKKKKEEWSDEWNMSHLSPLLPSFLPSPRSEGLGSGGGGATKSAKN